MTMPVAESSFHSLKVEVIYSEQFVMRKEMQKIAFEYIEMDRNRTNRHSFNGIISPEAFEAKMTLINLSTAGTQDGQLF